MRPSLTAAQGTLSAGESGPETEVAREETPSLISSDKVEGTSVYNPDGDKLGTVDSLMIDKRSGKVAYAVMSFGGFLGIGDRYHPLPWNVLTYDTGLDGYVVNLSKETLKEAPSFERHDMGLDRPEQHSLLHSYYGVHPYWV